jgi:hypothetical protein
MRRTKTQTPIDHDQDELARLFEEITQRLQAGESVDIEEYASGHPELSESLRRVFPTIVALAEIGREEACPLSLALSLNSAFRTPHSAFSGTLGDFRLIREIGRGGMGIVYEAEQISLSRRVALKILPFASVLDPRQLQRFKNEALAAAHLDHPNIVSVHGVGCERGVHYYAMRLVEGASLAEVIAALKGEIRGQTSEVRDESVVSRQSSVAKCGPATEHGQRTSEISSPSEICTEI